MCALRSLVSRVFERDFLSLCSDLGSGTGQLIVHGLLVRSGISPRHSQASTEWNDTIVTEDFTPLALSGYGGQP